MNADAVVRARIDTVTKERAAAALEAMGLSVSDAIRLLMLRIADEQRLPFDVVALSLNARQRVQQYQWGFVALKCDILPLNSRFLPLKVRQGSQGWSVIGEAGR
jgi:DNA-damage-inducible protein J